MAFQREEKEHVQRQGMGGMKQHVVFLEVEITRYGSKIWSKGAEWQEQQNLIIIS